MFKFAAVRRLELKCEIDQVGLRELDVFPRRRRGSLRKNIVGRGTARGESELTFVAMAFFKRVSTCSFCAIVLVRTARRRSGGISHDSGNASSVCSYVTRRFLLRSPFVCEFEGPAVAFVFAVVGLRFA